MPGLAVSLARLAIGVAPFAWQNMRFAGRLPRVFYALPETGGIFQIRFQG
jgi:hypothetical protein